MSRQTAVQELEEGLGTPRRSSRIASVTTRRASASEESATPAKAAKSRRLSQDVEDKVDNIGTPAKTTRRTSMSKSPSGTEDDKNVPLRRSTRRASTSSLTEEPQRTESPVFTTRRRSTRSTSPTSEPPTATGSTPRKSTRSVSSSPVPALKIRGRRNSVTEKVVPLEAIEESDLKTVDVAKDSEERGEVEVLSKKKMAIAKLNLQTILEKSIIEESNEVEEHKTEELESENVRKKESPKKNLNEIKSDQQDALTTKSKSRLSLSKDKSVIEEDLTDPEVEHKTASSDELESKSEHKEESTKNIEKIKSDCQGTPERQLLNRSPRRSSRLSSSTEKPTQTQVLQDSVENTEESIKLNLSDFNTSKDSFDGKEIPKKNSLNTSNSSDKENMSKEVNENISNRKLIVLADKLDLSQIQEYKRNSITNSSKQNSYYEPMDVDEYPFNVSEGNKTGSNKSLLDVQTETEIDKSSKSLKSLEKSILNVSEERKSALNQSFSKSELQVENNSKLSKSTVAVTTETDLNLSTLSKSQVQAENESKLDKSSKSPLKPADKSSSTLKTDSPEKSLNKSESLIQLNQTVSKPSTSSNSLILNDTKNSKSLEKVNGDSPSLKTDEKITNSYQLSPTTKEESPQVSKLMNNSGKRKTCSPLRKTLELDGDKSSLQTSKVMSSSEESKIISPLLTTLESNEKESSDQGVIIIETDFRNPRRKSLRLFNSSIESEKGLAYSTPKNKSKLNTTNENLNQSSSEEQANKSLNVSDILNKTDLETKQASLLSEDEVERQAELLHYPEEQHVTKRDKSNKSITYQESGDILIIDLENTSREQDQNKSQLNSNKFIGYSTNNSPLTTKDKNSSSIKETDHKKSPEENMKTGEEQNTSARSLNESHKKMPNRDLTDSNSEDDNNAIELKFSEESDEDDLVLQSTFKKEGRKSDHSLKDVEAKINSLIKNQESSDDDDDDETGNESVTDFLDNIAEEAEEDTPSEGSNDIVDHGESVGSSESEISSDDTYEQDSFIDDDQEDELLSGDEYDLGNEKIKKTEVKGKRKRKRIAELSDSEDEQQENISKSGEKIVSETKANINGIEDNSDLEKMSTQPYCGLTPPSIISLRESLSDNEKGNLAEEIPSSTVINQEDNLKSLEELKHQVPKITECITLKTSSSLTNTPQSLPDKTFTPNNSALDESTKSGRKRHSSITIQENIKLQDLEEGTIKDRISKVVSVFCNSVLDDKKDLSGNISLNVSVEYLQNVDSDATKQEKQSPRVDIPTESRQSIEKLPTPKKLDLSVSEKSPQRKSLQTDAWVTLSEDDTKISMNEKPKKKSKKRQKKQVTVQEDKTSDLDLSLDIDSELDKKYSSTSNNSVAALKNIPTVNTSKTRLSETTTKIISEKWQENETEEIKKRKRDQIQTSEDEILEIKTMSKKKKHKLKKNKTGDSEKSECDVNKAETLQDEVAPEEDIPKQNKKRKRKLKKIKTDDSEKLEYEVPKLEDLRDKIPPMHSTQKKNKKVEGSKTESLELEPTKKKSKINRDKSSSSGAFLCEPLNSTVQYLPSRILKPLIKKEHTKESESKPRKPKLLPSSSTASNNWNVEALPSKLLKKKQKQSLVESFHTKDFKNRMLFDQTRVNRTDTKVLLKKKQKIKA